MVGLTRGHLKIEQKIKKKLKKYKVTCDSHCSWSL